MEYNVISADAHIDLRWLPADLFVSNAPAKWKAMVPRLVDMEDGKHWFAEGRDLAQEEGFGRTLATTALPKQGIDKRVDLLHKVGFYDGRDPPSNPQIRLKDQTMDGVDAEVIYGILGMGKILQNRDLFRIVYQIYNDWVADFCQYNPDRFVGLACIPNHDPEAAADEVRRSTALGLRGGDFDVSSAVKPIWHRDWDPLWAAVAECSMPLLPHHWCTCTHAFRQPNGPGLFLPAKGHSCNPLPVGGKRIPGQYHLLGGPGSVSWNDVCAR